MKMNKKMIMTLSFCLGLLLLASTAFADIANKSGYDQLKDAVKFTSQSVSDSLQSVTMKATITLKDNDTVLMTGNTTQKMDLQKQMSENTSSTEYSSGKTQNTYSYRDPNSNIWYNEDSDTYYVSEYSQPMDYKLFPDPFKEDRVEDVEKIFDAVIGNLKDYVLVQENADGSKEFSGSLSEAQIPALANAVTSFLFKQAFSQERANNMNDPMELPQITKDIFIKNVKGKAVVNKEGLIESIFATGVLSGKDKNGITHDLTLEIAGRLDDINATTVQKPDLEGKKVEKNTIKNINPNTLSSKFVGTYKSDVIIEKDDAFVKIGEKFLVIAHIDDKKISGRYYEVYKEGYPQQPIEFTFDSEITDPYNVQIQYKDKEGKTQIGSLNFDMMSARIYLWLDNQKTPSDSTFSRVFED